MGATDSLYICIYPHTLFLSSRFVGVHTSLSLHNFCLQMIALSSFGAIVWLWRLTVVSGGSCLSVCIFHSEPLVNEWSVHWSLVPTCTFRGVSGNRKMDESHSRHQGLCLLGKCATQCPSPKEVRHNIIFILLHYMTFPQTHQLVPLKSEFVVPHGDPHMTFCKSYGPANWFTIMHCLLTVTENIARVLHLFLCSTSVL